MNFKNNYMTMKFTNKQMAVLSKFEDRMRTAVRSQWASPVSATELQRIVDILNDVTGSNRRANANCASCILEVLTDAGRIYFAQKEGEMTGVNHKVSKSSVKAANIKGVAVKMRKAGKK